MACFYFIDRIWLLLFNVYLIIGVVNHHTFQIIWGNWRNYQSIFCIWGCATITFWKLIMVVILVRIDLYIFIFLFFCIFSFYPSMDIVFSFSRFYSILCNFIMFCAVAMSICSVFTLFMPFTWYCLYFSVYVLYVILVLHLASCLCIFLVLLMYLAVF